MGHKIIRTLIMSIFEWKGELLRVPIYSKINFNMLDAKGFPNEMFVPQK